MTLEVDIQIASEEDDLPDPERIRNWVGAAVAARGRDTELTVRIVDEAESADLNDRYRGRSGATNVLRERASRYWAISSCARRSFVAKPTSSPRA